MAAEVSVQSGEGRTPEAGDEQRAEKKKKKEKRRGKSVCVSKRERARGEKKGLHAVHIDLALVMVMLQSSDPAPGLELYSV